VRKRAALIAEITGRPLAFVAITEEQLRAGLTKAGLPVVVVNTLVSIQASFAAGQFDIATGDVERLGGSPSQASPRGACWRAEIGMNAPSRIVSPAQQCVRDTSATRARIGTFMKATIPAILAVTLLVGVASAAPRSYEGHALVSRETSSVFDAAGATLNRAVDRVLVTIAVRLGGPEVAMHLHSRDSATR